MKYRIVAVNTKTGKRAVQYTTFTSKKKAIAYAEEWSKAMPNATAEVWLEDMKTRIF